MQSARRFSRVMLFACCAMGSIGLAPACAKGATEKVIFSFASGQLVAPVTPVLFGKNGDLYLTPLSGGYGSGGIIQITADGQFTGPSYAFYRVYPQSGLIQDASGNVYGTAQGNGSKYGEIYQFTPDGTFNVLFSLPEGHGKYRGVSGLVADSAGNFYGTASNYAYEFSASGVFTILHDFVGGHNDGKQPKGLIIDSAGNLYGVTAEGGKANAGTVFEISLGGKEKILYTFTGGADGAGPLCTLLRDSAGNLYGTAELGGVAQGTSGLGTVFKLSPSGVFTVLHKFTGGSDGRDPLAGLVMTKNGDLYGTTWIGGASGDGVVFKISAAGAESVVHSFAGGSDGSEPYAPLVLDAAGNLFGTTVAGRESPGSPDGGTVFEIIP